MAAPKTIENLVQRFESNINSRKSGHYNETRVRREFFDHFFEARGQDINNRQGFAEAFREIIHEDTVKIRTAARAPDYSFLVALAKKTLR